jgi:hypothetical protein
VNLVGVIEEMPNALKYTPHYAQIAMTCKVFKSGIENRLILKG